MTYYYSKEGLTAKMSVYSTPPHGVPIYNYVYNCKLSINQCCHCSLQGTLKGFDQTVNIILDESHERVFSSGSGVEQVLLGLYIIRGDNM